MALQNERYALDGGRVCAFAAFRQALFNQTLRIGQLRNALARVALAAGIVLQALTIGCLSEQARQSEFANTLRTGKKKCMRHATARECPAQCGHDTFVSQKLRKWHGQARSRPVTIGFTAERISFKISSGIRIPLRPAS